MVMVLGEAAVSPDGKTAAVVERLAAPGGRAEEVVCRIRLQDTRSGWSHLIRASAGRDCRALSWSDDGHLLFFARVGWADRSGCPEWLAYDLFTRRLLRLPPLPPP